jgi:hypothetical protein
MLNHELLGYFASTAACGREDGVAHEILSLFLFVFTVYLAFTRRPYGGPCAVYRFVIYESRDLQARAPLP